MNKLLLLLLIIALDYSIALDNQSGGLFFNSQNVANELRTSLNLTKNNKLSLPRNFALDFEMSLVDIRQYGYIFRLKTNEFNASLLYIQFKNRDTSYLQLIINNKVVQDQIPLPKNKFIRGNWFKVKLVIDGEGKKLTLSVNDGPSINSKINFSGSHSADLIFGIHRIYGAPDGDVPSMCLRNIKIFNEHNRIIHYWPLNETAGFEAKDLISNHTASVANPNWLINSHYKFKNVGQVGPFPTLYPEEAVPIVYSKSQDKIFFVSQNYYYGYDISSRLTKKEKFSKPLLHPDNVIVYNDKNNKFYAYYRGQGHVSVYNENQKAWSHIDTTGENKGFYYYHNAFINPLNDDLCMINGYGWYIFNNILQKYDFRKKKWIKLKTKGDFLVPRLVAASCAINDSGDFYIFGGLGNISGKQEETTKSLSDLYLLSMRDTSIKKIGELKSIPKDFVAFPTMHYDSLRNQLFMMGNSNYGVKKTYKRIYRYDINSKSFDTVSDTLYCSDNIGTPIFYSEKFSEIFAFERVNINADSFMINIHSLNYPPFSEKEYKEIKSALISSGMLNTINLIMFFTTLTALLGVGYYYLRRKKSKQVSTNESLNFTSKTVRNVVTKNNSINLFGNFQFIDKDGNDISSHFTPKLKQLFLLLFMKSYNGISRGITTESLTTYLWPDLNNEQTKNNRNVSLSKLRALFNNMDSIEITYEKGILELVLGGEVYNDFVNLKNIINGNQFGPEEISQINKITSRGEFLQECSYDWLEGQKLNFVENTIQILKAVAVNNNLDIKSKLLLSDSILHLDSVNEEALSLKVKALLELGDHQSAKKAFEHFKKKYYSLYAEEYQKSFADYFN